MPVLDAEDEAEILVLADKLVSENLTRCSSALCRNRVERGQSPAPFCRKCTETGAPRPNEGRDSAW